MTSEDIFVPELAHTFAVSPGHRRYKLYVGNVADMDLYSANQPSIFHA